MLKRKRVVASDIAHALGEVKYVHCTFSHSIVFFFPLSLKLFSLIKFPFKTKIFLTGNTLINFFLQPKKKSSDYNEWKIVINIL